MYSTNIRFESKVRGSFLLINLEPKGRGVYQWQTSDDQGQGKYICRIHYRAHGSCYRDVILALCSYAILYNKNCNYVYTVSLCQVIMQHFVATGLVNLHLPNYIIPAIY